MFGDPETISIWHFPNPRNVPKSLAQLRVVVGERIRPFKGTLLLNCTCEKQSSYFSVTNCMDSFFFFLSIGVSLAFGMVSGIQQELYEYLLNECNT